MSKLCQEHYQHTEIDSCEKKPFLTVEEAQKILGISRVNMYNLIHTKGFPVIQISPRRYIIPSGKLYAWLEQQIKN